MEESESLTLLVFCFLKGLSARDKEEKIMACFLVPAAEAIVTSVLTKAVEAKEKSQALESPAVEEQQVTEIAFSHKMKWLNNLLWGGSALLAFEHVWHGEVTPWAPFLTAASNPADMAQMVHEMSTVGVTMAVAVTAVWGGIVLVTGMMQKKDREALAQKKEG